MARTYKVTAAHANHHSREADGKVGELQQLALSGVHRIAIQALSTKRLSSFKQLVSLPSLERQTCP